jgi:predicted dithiol-disulfide oxidoreductase (DUF899 family)
MSTPMPPIVDRETWDAALQEEMQAEEALKHQVLAAAAARRRMPMTPVEGDYTFVGEEGEQSLADVFQGARQLVVYHFMFAPDWPKGCPHCTEYALNQGAGINTELGQRDTRYVLMSRAPYNTLDAYKDESGITTPWYSAPTAFSEEMGMVNDDFGDFPGVSVFFRDDDNNVYRTFKSNDFAVEFTMPASGMLRMTPYGMQEHGEDSPEGWPQRFDSM